MNDFYFTTQSLHVRRTRAGGAFIASRTQNAAAPPPTRKSNEEKKLQIHFRIINLSREGLGRQKKRADEVHTETRTFMENLSLLGVFRS